jgi:CASC3/Barentsz eIF4AIII binding
MSGRRRRNNEDSEEEDSDEEGTEDSGDNESEDEDEEATVGIEENVSIQKAVEYPTAIKVADPVASDVYHSDNSKFEPKDILKRNSIDEQQQDRDRREKNNKRREVKREADFFSNSQRKNPSFVPFSGNFFLHDDRDSTRLIGDGGEQSQLTEANLNKQAIDQNLNQNQQRSRCHTINSRAVNSISCLTSPSNFFLFDSRKERPNQRERGDRDDSRGPGTGTWEKDVWRHDKFEELLATERCTLTIFVYPVPFKMLYCQLHFNLRPMWAIHI